MATVTNIGEPFPSRDAVVGTNRKLTKTWTLWYEQLQLQMASVPQVQDSVVEPAGGNSSVAITPIGADQPAGEYRIAVYAQVIVAAGVSSSWTLIIRWTNNGIVQTKTFPVMNGNTVTTYLSDGLPLLQIDGGAVTYEIAYASNPASQMVYRMVLTLERIQNRAA